MTQGLPRKILLAIPLLWGWSEATWFFVIPDVWLTFTVFLGSRMVFQSIAAALLGAALGALTQWGLGPEGREWLLACWKVLPGYASAMLTRVDGEVRASGIWAFPGGPWEGIPFKMYLKQGLDQGIPGWQTLLISPIARAPRFVLIPLISGAIRWLLHRLFKVFHREFPFDRWLALVYLAIWGWIYYEYWMIYLPGEFS